MQLGPTKPKRHPIINICHMLVIQMIFLVGTNLVRMEVNQVIDDIVAKVLVDDPVHELEARKGDWKNDAAVLVNVRGRHAEHLVQVLHIALRIWGWGSWRGWKRWRARWYRWQGW